MAWTDEDRRASAKRYREKNREKCNEASRRSRERHPKTEIEGHLKRTYGLTLDAYNEMLAEQGGVCWICKGPPNGRVKKLVVDHDHETDRIRRLLCDACNRAIGFMRDDPKRLRDAAAYLEAHGASPAPEPKGPFAIDPV